MRLDGIYKNIQTTPFRPLVKEARGLDRLIELCLKSQKDNTGLGSAQSITATSSIFEASTSKTSQGLLYLLTSTSTGTVDAPALFTGGRGWYGRECGGPIAYGLPTPEATDDIIDPYIRIEHAGLDYDIPREGSPVEKEQLSNICRGWSLYPLYQRGLLTWNETPVAEISQTDANGNTIRFTYDLLGRRIDKKSRRDKAPGPITKKSPLKGSLFR